MKARKKFQMNFNNLLIFSIGKTMNVSKRGDKLVKDKHKMLLHESVDV
jgi:hypothetical protein